MKEQRLELVRGDKTEEVNALLKDGWVAVHISSMADKAFSDTACYMVLEKNDKPEINYISTLPEEEKRRVIEDIDYVMRSMGYGHPEKPLIPEVDYDEPICNGSGIGGKDD